MPDNPSPPPDREFALPGHALLALSGRDAVAFAQAQFMNDVAALVDGQWQWNGWLSPKGRVVALFALLRLDAETLWLLLPDADAHALAAQLQRFVFRSKLILAPRDDLHASGAFATPAQASGSKFVASGEALELDVGGDGGPRRLRIGSAKASQDEAQASAWGSFDLRHGLPRLRGGQVEAWTPQQLSLDRLRAFSVRKGCYPGQEIVARTHFLGQAKRGLWLLQASDAIADDAVIAAAGRATGSIICTQGRDALAVMPLDAPMDALQAGGVALKRGELLGGLAR